MDLILSGPNRPMYSLCYFCCRIELFIIAARTLHLWETNNFYFHKTKKHDKNNKYTVYAI